MPTTVASSAMLVWNKLAGGVSSVVPLLPLLLLVLLLLLLLLLHGRTGGRQSVTTSSSPPWMIKPWNSTIVPLTSVSEGRTWLLVTMKEIEPQVVRHDARNPVASMDPEATTSLQTARSRRLIWVI